MPFSPLRPTLAQWGLLAVAVVGFAYILISLGGADPARQILPGSGNSRIAYLASGHETASIDEVAALPESQWQEWKTAGFAPPSQPSHVLWARVILKNSDPEREQGILADAQHFEDHVECFLPGESGAPRWIHLRTGEWTPSTERPIWGRENAFPITVPANGEQTIYLRYEDFFGNWLAFIWWPKQAAFHAAQQRATLAEGLYFGTLFALLFYNGILWVKLRLPPTGSYLLYLGSFTLFMFFARSAPQEFGWAIGSPWLEAVLTAALAASGAFLLSFADLFLDLPTYLPRAHRWLQRARVVMIASAVVSILTPWIGLTAFLKVPALFCAVVHLGVFGVAIAARRVGAAQASYMVLAIGALFAGLLPTVFFWLDLLSISDGSRVIMAGSAIEMLLLAILMSDRIGLLQQQKIAAQKALLLEAEQRETMQEAYADDLALEVRERTSELEQINADKDRILTVLGHDLRSPLTGLTRSAEHWSQKSADDPGVPGFIAEAAQTGRQLLLLIEDLVMWARLRAGTSHLAEHSLDRLASPVVALHQPHAASSGITITVALPPQITVKTDLVPVQALLRNLLANALRAAQRQVAIEAAAVGDRVQVSITDDGPGLADSIASAINAEDGGHLPNIHGLGLRLCLEISRHLGLQLRALPAPSGGTTFQFSLPAVEP